MATASLALWDRLPAEIGEDVGFRPLRPALSQRRRGRDRRLGELARFRPHRRASSRTCSRRRRRPTGRPPASAGRAASSLRPTASPIPSRAAPVIARGVLKLGRHGPPVLRRARHRARGRPRARRRHRKRHDPDHAPWCSRAAPGPPPSATSSASAFRKPRSVPRSCLSRRGRKDCRTRCIPPASRLTRRGDGGYTLAISGRGRVDPTPQQLRFAPPVPADVPRRWRSLAPGRPRRPGARATRPCARWRLDAPTPMERNRILDPRPDRRPCRARPSPGRSSSCPACNPCRSRALGRLHRLARRTACPPSAN